MPSKYIAFVALLFLCWPGSLMAETNQPIVETLQTDFVRRHDKGLYLRLELGPTWTYLVSSAEHTAASGFLVSGEVAIGGLVDDGVALHATGWAFGAAERSAIGLGPGVTHYLGGAAGNVFLSAAAGPMIIPDEKGLQWALGGETSLGIYGWLGNAIAAGGSLVVGGYGFDLQANGRLRQGLWIGVRAGVSYD